MIAVTTSLHLMRGKWDLHDFSAALSDYIQSNMQKRFERYFEYRRKGGYFSRGDSLLHVALTFITQKNYEKIIKLLAGSCG